MCPLAQGRRSRWQLCTTCPTRMAQAEGAGGQERTPQLLLLRCCGGVPGKPESISCWVLAGGCLRFSASQHGRRATRDAGPPPALAASSRHRVRRGNGNVKVRNFVLVESKRKSVCVCLSLCNRRNVSYVSVFRQLAHISSQQLLSLKVQ